MSILANSMQPQSSNFCLGYWKDEALVGLGLGLGLGGWLPDNSPRSFTFQSPSRRVHSIRLSPDLCQQKLLFFFLQLCFGSGNRARGPYGRHSFPWQALGMRQCSCEGHKIWLWLKGVAYFRAGAYKMHVIKRNGNGVEMRSPTGAPTWVGLHLHLHLQITPSCSDGPRPPPPDWHIQ